LPTVARVGLKFRAEVWADIAGLRGATLGNGENNVNLGNV
jgi:hypothetical protein